MHNPYFELGRILYVGIRGCFLSSHGPYYGETGAYFGDVGEYAGEEGAYAGEGCAYAGACTRVGRGVSSFSGMSESARPHRCGLGDANGCTSCPIPCFAFTQSCLMVREMSSQCLLTHSTASNRDCIMKILRMHSSGRT